MRRASAAMGLRLLGAIVVPLGAASCVAVISHDTRPVLNLRGSKRATLIAAGGCQKSCPPGSPKLQPGDNCTGIYLEKGHSYLFQAQPSTDFADGKDIRLSNLDGWDSPLLQPLRWKKRKHDEPYFTLIGTINGKNPFRIHEGMCFRAPTEGWLVCYVNDWPTRYFNNYGTVTLQVTPCDSGTGTTPAARLPARLCCPAFPPKSNH